MRPGGRHNYQGFHSRESRPGMSQIRLLRCDRLCSGLYMLRCAVTSSLVVLLWIVERRIRACDQASATILYAFDHAARSCLDASFAARLLRSTPWLNCHVSRSITVEARKLPPTSARSGRGKLLITADICVPTSSSIRR